MYYNECPFCWVNLDPGEKCDCQEYKEYKKELQVKGRSGNKHE